MRFAPMFLAAICALLWCTSALAEGGSITYRARVVHQNRSQLSFVNGGIDLASGDFSEVVEHSYNLDWRRMPGVTIETRLTLPDIYRVAGRAAQRFGSAMPRFDSQLLRHFIVAEIITGGDDLEKGDTFLSGQLTIESVEVKRGNLEVVALFRGMPLVIVGRRDYSGGRWLVNDLAILGPTSELYQYFFDEIEYAPRPLASSPALPVLDPASYITFPEDGPVPVAIRPIKDWLVFQAQLPNGRPLNLVLDSGAETMILDELVLKVDALLEPIGEMQVAGAFGSGAMNIYEDFSFEVGGVRFDNLQVAGTQLTSLGMGAGLRIHGIVGSEILQLTRLDIDLGNGELLLHPPGEPIEHPGEDLQLTFIGRLPHVEVEVRGTDSALMMLDTGQRTGLAVNLDWLDHYGMDEKLMLNGFLGDINGGLAPRYIVEDIDLNMAGQTYHENAADASPEATFTYDGMPVVGAIGFPLLARHYGNLSFDYTNKLLRLGEPGENREFTGRPEAWEVPLAPGQAVVALADVDSAEVSDEGVADAGFDYAVALVVQGAGDPPRPELLPDVAGDGGELPEGDGWTTGSENPLDLVRIMMPGLLPLLDKGFSGWRTAIDPRHSPIILPDRSGFNDFMNEGLLEDYRPLRELPPVPVAPPVSDLPELSTAQAVMAVRVEFLAASLFRMISGNAGLLAEPVTDPAAEFEAGAEEVPEDGPDSETKPAGDEFKRGLPKLIFN